MEVTKTEINKGASPGSFSSTPGATTPGDIFGLFEDLIQTNVDDYLENKGIDPGSVSGKAKSLMKYLTKDLGCVSAGVQLYGYDTAKEAMDILGLDLKPKNEYFT